MHTRLSVGLDTAALDAWGRSASRAIGAGLEGAVDHAAAIDAQARRMGIVPPAGVVESASRLADIASRGPEAMALARTPILDSVDHASPAIMGLLGRIAR